MGSRYELEITITSAKDLKNVNWRHGKIKPYAVVWIDTAKKCSTHVDDDGDTSPHWNEKLTIPFSSPIDDSTLHIDIVHASAAEDTKPLIGSAKLPLRDVGLGSRTERTLELKRPSGRPHGKLEVSVTVREPGYRAPDPYYAPPFGVPPPGTRDYAPPPGVPPPGARDYAPPLGVPPPGARDYAPPLGVPPPGARDYGPYGNPYGTASAYGAQPSGYPAYGAHPSAYPAYGAPGARDYSPYGAPPSSYPGYGAPPSYDKGAHYGEEKKKSKFGGMGTGLAVGAVAGALGGLALAEGADALKDKIADDVADRVEDDLGYDGDDF